MALVGDQTPATTYGGNSNKINSSNKFDYSENAPVWSPTNGYHNFIGGIF